MSLPRLQLRPDADRRLRGGHVWIYSNEIDTKVTPLTAFTAGEQAVLVNSEGRTLGIVMVNPHTLICARLVSRDEQHPLSRSLMVHRLNIALSLRERAFATPHYRLVYGDSDGLPGLVVDRFGDHLVVQISTAGMELMKDDIIAALQKVLKPAAILLKNNHSGRALEALPEYCEEVGAWPDMVEVIENGTRMAIDARAGQKTGWFYDHRMNRARMQAYAHDKTVLDIFSYVGGWGLQALTAGAREVTCVDSSAWALDCAQHNAEQLGVAEQLTCFEGNAADALKALVEEKRKFDIVILDPPAFIKKRKDHAQGMKAYHQYNQLAMRLVERDGLLVSGSCSMHLQRNELVEVLRVAGRHIDREVQIIEQGGQGADHPVLPAIPETEYLKCAIARVYRW